MLYEVITREGTEPEYAVVVLVNGGSASASEIVAGSLQDHRRGLVIGTETFGKGSVQTIIPLDNEGGLRLTTALYYLPTGRSIQEVRIQPVITSYSIHYTKLYELPLEATPCTMPGPRLTPGTSSTLPVLSMRA